MIRKEGNIKMGKLKTSEIYWIWCANDDVTFNMRGIVVNWFYEQYDLVVYLN
jgi:hypothetical protein